ncbi:MAG: transcriptional regulator FtrA [Methylobacterium sp.]|nr:transcriptional regulator FtrA [Methylobacterium sp.]
MTFMVQIMPSIATPAATPAGPLVVALVYDGLCTFEFAITSEIFGLARPEMGPDWYRFRSVAIEPGPMQAQGGLRFECESGLELLDEASLIVVPGWKGAHVPVPEALVERLRAAHDRGARLASICSGAFVLAATGLLDRQRAATHWRYAELLAARHPAIAVDAPVLYCEADGVYTSAGSAAGIDLMLHIIRQDFGVEAANSVARRLVMPPHRAGGQAQFIPRPVPLSPAGKLSGLLEAIRANPQRDWSVREMAERVAMSQRTFIRRFTETTGLPPGEWVIAMRIEAAKALLEGSGLMIEDVAQEAGFGSVEVMRHHFRKGLGLSPREYRETFSAGRTDGPPQVSAIS